MRRRVLGSLVERRVGPRLGWPSRSRRPKTPKRSLKRRRAIGRIGRVEAVRAPVVTDGRERGDALDHLVALAADGGQARRALQGLEEEARSRAGRARHEDGVHDTRRAVEQRRAPRVPVAGGPSRGAAQSQASGRGHTRRGVSRRVPNTSWSRGMDESRDAVDHPHHVGELGVGTCPDSSRARRGEAGHPVGVGAEAGREVVPVVAERTETAHARRARRRRGRRRARRRAALSMVASTSTAGMTTGQFHCSNGTAGPAALEVAAPASTSMATQLPVGLLDQVPERRTPHRVDDEVDPRGRRRVVDPVASARCRTPTPRRQPCAPSRSPAWNTTSGVVCTGTWRRRWCHQ